MASPKIALYYDAFQVDRYLSSEPEIGSFTANPNPVTSGSSTILTAPNITDGNPNSSIKQVTFYYIDSGGTRQVLGTGTQTSPGVWTCPSRSTWHPVTTTLFAQTEDNYGVFGDPFALTLQVIGAGVRHTLESCQTREGVDWGDRKGGR